MDPAAPDRLLGGRYRLLRHLARGGMATVWLGEDMLLARRVAVKTLHPELAADPSLRTRFRNEAISSASIEAPGIVAIYDAGDDDGVVFMVLEYVEGRDLRQLLDERGPLPPREATRIAERVARALEQAHEHGLVHRDVKPANVLVAADGRVKVTDFGIAKATRGGDDLTSTGTVIGTARYLAPEQVRGDATDARADVYATGLLLYEMLTGRRPFHGDTDLAAALARLSVPPEPLPPSVPPTVSAVVTRCLALDPADRYPSAGALADALSTAGDGDLTVANEVTSTLLAPPRRTAAPAGPAAPATPRGRGRRRLAALLVLVVLGGAAAAYLALRPSARTPAPPPPPRIVAAQDYDPFGNDQQENHALVGLAIDGNLQTAWPTEIYATRNLGNAKSGVGLYVTLAAATTVHAVTVDTVEPEWNGAIYVAATLPTTFSGWGRPLAPRVNLGTHSVLMLHHAAPVRYVLLWITYLPPSGRLDVAEIHVR